MKPTREQLYSIARHSNWRADSIEDWFRKAGIYASPRDWARLVNWLLLGLGVGFVVAGIVFFFAYNWADMHKFVKLGMLEALILILTAIVLFSRASKAIKNLLLTGNAILVGVFFAVFGQIYQTGANAYDFFLSWTCFVALWVVVAKYPPLWGIFLGLVNTTLVLYANQVATHWPTAVLLDMLFVLNALAVLLWEMLVAKRQIGRDSRWFPRVVCLAAVGMLTFSMMLAIFENLEQDRGLCFLLAAVGYTAGIWHGRRTHDLFYLSVIPFSSILVAASLIVRVGEDSPEFLFLVASLFVIGTTTLLIRNIIRINHKWHG